MTTASREKPPEPLVLEVMDPSCQPSKAELEEDLPVDANFDEAVRALARPVKAQWFPKRQRAPFCARVCCWISSLAAAVFARRL